MNVNRIEQHQQAIWRLEKTNQQRELDESYRKLIEQRRFDAIVAERVRRNIRLDADRGTHFDAEV